MEKEDPHSNRNHPAGSLQRWALPVLVLLVASQPILKYLLRYALPDWVVAFLERRPFLYDYTGLNIFLIEIIAGLFALALLITLLKLLVPLSKRKQVTGFITLLGILIMINLLLTAYGQGWSRPLTDDLRALQEDCHEIPQADLESTGYFNPLHGYAEVWYRIDSDGNIVLYDGPCLHRSGSTVLKPVTQDIVAQWRQTISPEKRVSASWSSPPYASLQDYLRLHDLPRFYIGEYGAEGEVLTLELDAIRTAADAQMTFLYQARYAFRGKTYVRRGYGVLFPAQGQVRLGDAVTGSARVGATGKLILEVTNHENDQVWTLESR